MCFSCRHVDQEKEFPHLKINPGYDHEKVRNYFLQKESRLMLKPSLKNSSASGFHNIRADNALLHGKKYDFLTQIKSWNENNDNEKDLMMSIRNYLASHSMHLNKKDSYKTYNCLIIK